ncbi:MAG: hypothetical protein JW808_08710 [Victivallales bacterium]|nr:hypothetical protein [Victivallales bacterium]
MEKEEKKGTSSQNVLNVILVIICGAIMGLFVYDYINKNNQIAELRDAERESAKQSTKELEVKWEQRVNRLADIYRDTSMSNVPVAAEAVVSGDENERIKSDIARNISQNLSPIMAKIDEGHGMTNEKLDKIMNDLIELIDKEIQKGVQLRQQMAEEIAKERAIAGVLQSHLTETQKIVSELNGFTSEMKGLYLSEKPDDSAFGDIGRAAMCVPQFAKNVLTFDWYTSTDRIRAKNELDAKHREIMDRFEAVGKDGVEIRRVPLVSVRRNFFDWDIRPHVERKPEEPELVK